MGSVLLVGVIEMAYHGALGKLRSCWGSQV